VSTNMELEQINQHIHRVLCEQLRCGSGVDFHSLNEGYPLVLAGVIIPSEQGFRVKRSDGDPVSHAIVDAILAAMGAGDIADWFNDEDGIDDARSINYLRELHHNLLAPRKITIVNVQAIILAEKPKLKPFFLQMQTEIASSLAIEPDRVALQAKTFEGKGIIGNQEGIEVRATSMLLLPVI
nr:2-C-methyl-D-erythritol 2,4-cyclodiphosphate synthase [Ktedonobacteraceae bacterium]